MSNILVVDDNEDNLYALSQRIESQKINTITAQNGQQALFVAREKQPDLILLDIHMPLMDGFETCRLLKEDSRTKNIPVIFLTAKYPDIDNKVKGLDLGAHDYLIQPCHPAELMAKIRGALRQKKMYDQLNKVLFQKEKLADVGKMATSIVHEINNPLTAIASVFSLLKDDMPESNKYLEAAENGIDRIQQIIEQLLNFHRPRCMEKSLIDLNKVFQESLGLSISHLRRQGIRVVREFSEDLRPVQAVSQQLSMVSLNLIINASEAMMDGGTLSLGSKNQDTKTIKVWIRDTGTGILPENLSKIFEPCFTTKASGSGIGLFLVKTLVEANRGQVEVQSQPGQGSEFTLTFPAYEEQRAQ